MPSDLPSDTPSSPSIAEKAWKTVWTLAWPAVALNVMQVFNTLLDNFFVGHLSENNLTAYGAVTSVMFLMFSLAMSIGTAATALVSRAYGAGNQEEYRAATRQALAWATVLGIFFAICGGLMAPYTASLLVPQGNSEAADIMARYQLIYACGIPGFFVVQALAGCLRGVGDTKSPMFISGVQIVLHMILNLFLISPSKSGIPGIDMGLMGAATALSVSAWLSAGLYLVFAAKTKLGKVSILNMPQKEWGHRLLKIAIPTATMSVLRVASLFVFQVVLKYSFDGGAAIAGMRTGFALESIMFMPAFGLSMAATALVGQSLGMQKPDRAEKLAWTAAHHAAIVTLCLVVPTYFLAPQIVATMVQDKTEVIKQAVMLIRYLCVTEVFFAYAMVMIGAMQGAGDAKRPLWITIVCLWFLRVPLATILALGPPHLVVGFALGASGAWIAMSVTQALQGMLAMWAFKQGAWKTMKV